jgi:hypothetical protein
MTRCCRVGRRGRGCDGAPATIPDLDRPDLHDADARDSVGHETNKSGQAASNLGGWEPVGRTFLLCLSLGIDTKVFRLFVF